MKVICWRVQEIDAVACNTVHLASGAYYDSHLLARAGTRCCVARCSMRQALTMSDICWREQELDVVSCGAACVRRLL